MLATGFLARLRKRLRVRNPSRLPDGLTRLLAGIPMRSRGRRLLLPGGPLGLMFGSLGLMFGSLGLAFRSMMLKAGPRDRAGRIAHRRHDLGAASLT
jgi:hypothetical protein